MIIILLTKTIMITWCGNNKKWYEFKGYVFTKYKDKFEVKIIDLPKQSNQFVKVKCDSCGEIINIRFCDYNKYLYYNKLYYCNKCVNKLIVNPKSQKTKLLRTKSFYQWCIDNNKELFLKLWDYDLNECDPKNISYASSKKCYFKCPKNKHESKLYRIEYLSHSKDITIQCNQCNSFAQWGIDNICPDFLERYWDYEKNKNIDPWNISSRWNRKVWIKCQEKDYHKSYDTICSNFIKGNRCPYCSHHKIHKLDSLGSLYPQVLGIWSNKNDTTPYEYATQSNRKVWWKCHNGKHEDYKRNIFSSLKCNFRCPQCDFSIGEKKISSYLVNYNILYEPQKTFENLIGMGNGLLSYDFYLPTYNLLIEYQGEQHEYPVDFDGKGMKQAKENFKKQREHDRRKKQYAIDNNIKLLEIWYWDYDNIEKILDKEVGEIKK